MRPYWKGYLKLALVSCPISLHAACSSAEHIGPAINKATGNRLRQQLIDEETRACGQLRHRPARGQLRDRRRRRRAVPAVERADERIPRQVIALRHLHPQVDGA